MNSSSLYHTFIRYARFQVFLRWNAQFGHPVTLQVFAPTSSEARTLGPEFVAHRLTPPAGTQIIWVVQSYWERPQSTAQQYLSANYNLLEVHQFSPELRVVAYWKG